MYILTNGIVAIGPFEQISDAEYYRFWRNLSPSWRTMEILNTISME